MSLLKKILQIKEKEVLEIEKQVESLIDARELPQDDRSQKFPKALKQNKAERTSIAVIAECKKASPSSGLLRSQYEPEKIAASYKRCGAAALSVLTEREFFLGHISHLGLVKDIGLPVLRKDFLISPLQIYQSKLAGADAVLLIARLLSFDKLKELYELAREIALGVLLEVHSEEEIDMALELSAPIVGINHRNLESLKIDMSLSRRLIPYLRARQNSDTIVVAESGIESSAARKELAPDIDAVLIGTAFMKSPNIALAWKEIFS